MSSKQKYSATIDGWVAGRRVMSGEIIELTPAQAKYETNVAPVTATTRAKREAAPE